MSTFLDTVDNAIGSVNASANGTGGFDLSKYVKLPTVNTALSLSRSAMVFIGGAVLVIGLMIFKNKRR